MDLPEGGRGLGEFDAHLRFPALRHSYVYDAAAKILSGGLVRHRQNLALRDLIRHQDQRAVSVHDQSFRVFFKIFSVRGLAAKDHGYSQEYTEAASAPFINRPFGRSRLGHRTTTIASSGWCGNPTAPGAVPK